MSTTLNFNMRLYEGLRTVESLFSQIQFHLHFDSYSGDFSRIPSSLYLPFTLTILVLVITAFPSGFGRTPVHTKSSLPPLRALLHVLTPACSSWPQKYIRLSKAGYHRIPLKTLVEDVISGKIELRAPEKDIKQLLVGKGGLDVRGCKLLLSLGLSLRLSVWWWWMKSALYAGQKLAHVTCNANPRHESSEFGFEDEIETTQPSLSRDLNSEYMRLEPLSEMHPPDTLLRSRVPRFRTDSDASTPYSILPVLLPTLPPHVLEKLAVATTLDSTSMTCVETMLLGVPPGSLALLEFTSCDPRISLGSTPWVLSLLPLARANRVSRTTTLAGVLALLEGVSVLLSVQNVSTQYALLLEDYAHGLKHARTRKLFLATQDTENMDKALMAWRAEMLWAHWGSACYTTGGLARWVVCVRKLSIQ